jgi:transposase
MQKEVIEISQKELTRYEVLRRVNDGTISLKEASYYMGVSYRQAIRINKDAKGGISFLTHGNRGKTASNRLSEDIRSRVLELSQGDYKEFNDTHFTEELAKLGINISRETVRAIRRSAGIAPKRKRRPKKHHKRRSRKTSEGLMMLWDGSPHKWFGKDYPSCCLMAAMDDSTGKILALLFCENECSWAYLNILRQVVKKHGIPCSIYQDKHTALKRNDNFWSIEEELAGRQEPTQVGLALDDLGIKPIFANSPQAKGRIERLFETLQDRLVAELVMGGITSIEAANEYVNCGYIDRFNERFAVSALDKHRWRRLEAGMDIDKICSFRYSAKVANDNAVRFCGLIFDIAEGPRGRSYARCEVELRQLLDGSWRIYYDDKLIAKADSTEIGEPFRAKSRRRNRRAASSCEWIYLAHRQRALIDEKEQAHRPKASIRRTPGKAIGATRIA